MRHFILEFLLVKWQKGACGGQIFIFWTCPEYYITSSSKKIVMLHEWMNFTKPHFPLTQSVTFLASSTLRLGQVLVLGQTAEATHHLWSLYRKMFLIMSLDRTGPIILYYYRIRSFQRWDQRCITSSPLSIWSTVGNIFVFSNLVLHNQMKQWLELDRWNKFPAIIWDAPIPIINCFDCVITN